ncbi:thioredoxin-disulfide reductase [Anaerolinea thermophila]|jgi:thioredoxin reductase (NADPH)|uniref:thioredoxin-disulfide reductase n=2 Tax=Anaerolinea TaxID=233189 RepID=UPI0026F08465|nr:thioredoxin-disulfide reductase [Anaerolinea thermophila]
MDFNLINLTSHAEEEKEHHPYKVVILGSGPAGLAAALYAARAELNPLVLTGMELGGQAALTHTIENYPGFPDGVGGSQLGELFQKQAERFGARIEFDIASKVDLSRRPFVIETESGQEIKAQTLIIATGASPNHLNVPGEKELTGKGVSYCATCDGWFFKDKEVVVIGGGDSALEEGLFLTRYATKVTIIHRRDTLRAGAILQSRAKANPKIQFIWNTVVTEILGEDAVKSVRLKNVVTGEESTFPTDGVFIFIGHKPNTQLFMGQLEMDEGGYIITDKKMQTSVPGVYAAGEAADPIYRQVITSAGMGAAAAMQAARFLEEHE